MTVRCRALSVVVIFVGVSAAFGLTVDPAIAQDPTTTTTETEEVPTRDIVPAPDSGEEPTEAGDRGGALQLGLLAAVVAGIGLVVYLARRQSLRDREQR